MLIAIVILAALYFSLAVLFLWGSFRESRMRGKDKQWRPSVSIVIAAKDEQAHISNCLDSLLNQNYPRDRYDIFVADDCSEDCTTEIVKTYTTRFPNVHLLQVTSPSAGLRGKQNAIAQAIEKSEGEIILTTDANCRVPSTWVSKTIDHFSPEVGLVGGFTLFETDNLFAKLQSLDLLYLLGIGWGTTGIGKPTSVIAKNMGFRRESYEKAGGYQSIGFTIVEDMALLVAIRDTHCWRIRFIADPGQAVTAHPSNGLAGFLHQRKRWALAGFRRVSALGRFVLVVAFCSRLLTISLLLLSLLGIDYLRLAAIFFLVTSLSDFLILCRSTLRLKRGDLLKYSPLIFPFQLFYQSIVGILVLFGRRQILWKGRRYYIRLL